jgi:hypothetical protein
MRRSITTTVAALVLCHWSIGTARGDGLGRTGYETLAGIGLSLVVGGLALSLAIILAGVLLIRGYRSHPSRPGVWGRVGFLALFGILVIVGGPILTIGFGLTTALVIGALVLLLATILGVLGWVRQHRRRDGRIGPGEIGPQGE